MTSIGCRVGPDRGGLRDTVPPFVAGGKPPTHVRIMASSAQSAVTRDPSAVDDAATVPRYGLRSARWRLMALLLVRRRVCAARRRPPLHCEWVLPECGCREGAVLTYPFKVKSLRRVGRYRPLPPDAPRSPLGGCSAVTRQFLSVGGLGDTPSACRNSAHKRSDRNAPADRISFRGGRKRSGLARCGCLA